MHYTVIGLLYTCKHLRTRQDTGELACSCFHSPFWIAASALARHRGSQGEILRTTAWPAEGRASHSIQPARDLHVQVLEFGLNSAELPLRRVIHVATTLLR